MFEDLILGKEKSEALYGQSESAIDASSSDWMTGLDLKKKLRLYYLYKRTKSYINLMVDVQGHQILTNGVFQGDPHNGKLTSAVNKGDVILLNFLFQVTSCSCQMDLLD